MDVDSPASRTALGAARHRALHQLLEAGAVFSDPLAVPILGLPETDLRARDADRRMRLFIAARQRYAEDVLADAVPRGVDQLVVLGAGLDTFGYRNPYAGLRVVELDHPATQAWKRERLEAASIAVPPSLTHAAIDFERDDLETVLGEHVDTERPVLFWWLGVTPYLTLEAITTTLTTLGSLPPQRGGARPRRAQPGRDARGPGLVGGAAGPGGLARRAVDHPARAGGPRPAADRVRLRAHPFEDEVALIRRLLGVPPAAERRVTHLALATTGWPARPSGEG